MTTPTNHTVTVFTRFHTAITAPVVHVKDLGPSGLPDRADVHVETNYHIADAREALQELLDDARQASAKQLEEARLADADRLTDMQTAHDDQKRQEDNERGIRLQRQADDHGKQLAAMATAHNDRITQIGEQEKELKQDRQDAFLAQLDDLSLFHTEWLKRQTKLQEDQLKLFDAFWKAQNKRFVIGEVPSIANPTTGVKYPPIKMPEGIGPVPNNPYERAASAMLGYGSMYNVPMPASVSNVNTNSTSRSVSVGDIIINGAPGDSVEDFAAKFEHQPVRTLEKVNGDSRY